MRSKIDYIKIDQKIYVRKTYISLEEFPWKNDTNRFVHLINEIYPHRILKHGFIDGSFFVEYEFIDGISLREYAKKLCYLEERDYFRVLKKIINDLKAHISCTSPFFHNDLSLDNILVKDSNLIFIDLDDIDYLNNDFVRGNLLDLIFQFLEVKVRSGKSVIIDNSFFDLFNLECKFKTKPGSFWK